MRYYVDRIAQTVRNLRSTTLSGLIGELKMGETVDKETLVGSFCALLELIKIGVVNVEQEPGHGEIAIRLSAEHADDVEGIVRASRFDDEVEEEPDDAGPIASAEPADPAPADEEPTDPSPSGDADPTRPDEPPPTSESTN